MNAYAPQSDDTAPDVDRAVFDGLRAMTPVQRLRLAAAASRALHRVAVAGLRLRYPEASPGELWCRAGVQRVGRRMALLALGPEAEAWLA